jgi:RNA polymerase sigma factor (sigma-70 family)
MEGNTSQPDPARLLVHDRFVRTQLRRFGVPPSLVEDLTQEIWLLALARAPVFPDEGAARGWLAAVCRRMAANERRSRARSQAFHGALAVDEAQPARQVELIEQERLQDGVAAAAVQLNHKLLDVLCLYGSGELTMREVAGLIGTREPTAYARYRSAVAAVANQHTPGSVGVRAATAAYRASSPLYGGSDEEADMGKFVFYCSNERLVLGRLGNVVLARWRQRMYEQSSELLGATLATLRQRLGMSLVLVNDVDPGFALPSAAERRTVFRHMRATIGAAPIMVDIFDISVARVLTAIIVGLMSITQANRSSTLVVVRNIEGGRPWIEPHARCASGPLPWHEVRTAHEAIWREP